MVVNIKKNWEIGMRIVEVNTTDEKGVQRNRSNCFLAFTTSQDVYEESFRRDISSFDPKSWMPSFLFTLFFFRGFEGDETSLRTLFDRLKWNGLQYYKGIIFDFLGIFKSKLPSWFVRKVFSHVGVEAIRAFLYHHLSILDSIFGCEYNSYAVIDLLNLLGVDFLHQVSCKEEKSVLIRAFKNHASNDVLGELIVKLKLEDLVDYMPKGGTALHVLACREDASSLLLLLLKRLPEQYVNVRNNDGEMAFHCALEKENIAAINLLLPFYVKYSQGFVYIKLCLWGWVSLAYQCYKKKLAEEEKKEEKTEVVEVDYSKDILKDKYLPNTPVIRSKGKRVLTFLREGKEVSLLR